MLYPDIEFPKQPAGDIGKYGCMCKDYLEKYRPIAYRMMVLEDTLKQHLMDVNEQAHEMHGQLIDSMKRSEGVTEQLRAVNQMEWAQRMNSIKYRAEETIKAKLVKI